MPQNRLLALFLTLACWLPLQAAEPEEQQATTVAQEAAEPQVPAVLVGIPGVVTDEQGRHLWARSDGGPELVVGELLADAFMVSSPVGPIRVQRSGAMRDGAGEAIRRMLELAAPEGVQASDNAPLVFDHSFLTGFRLKSGGAIVTSEGVMHRKRLPTADHGEAQVALKQAITRIEEALPASGLDSTVQRVLGDTVSKLDGRDGDQEFDEMPPGYARRLVRHGFLDRALPGNPAADALEQQVLANTRFEPTVAFAGEGLSIELLANALGDQAWVYRRPDQVSIAVRPPLPEYGWHVENAISQTWLIVRWSGEADPTDSVPAGDLIAAQLVNDDSVLAGWNAEDGFSSDREAWRATVPEQPQRQSQLVDDYLPPHIVVTNLHGDILGIAVERGFLPSLPSHDEGGVDAFLDRAAELLPDAAHLDLIGQYLLQYVYDSPEPTLPFIPGNRTVNSDIHQTARQTLLSSVGGICRGDCDDLSELYHEIITRQGKLGHVLSLPGHAACGWAEQQDDGSWSSFVLQTGQALQFDAAELPDSLVAAYKHFSEEDTIDPNGLGLLLRFSGENTRSAWRLSWRIFAEPDYAATMIDVQRDWHFQTYQRAIHKMQEMIAEGDHDNANYRELAGLYNFTGQYELAALYLEQALELTPEDDSRLFMSSEIFDHWAAAGRDDKAEAVITRILDELLPAQKEQLGGAAVQLGLNLIATMVDNRMFDHIGRVEREYVTETIGEQGDRVIGWLQSSFDKNRWQTAGFIRQLRRWLRMHARLAMDVLERVERDTVLSDPGLAEMVRNGQRYMQYVAPYDADDPSEITGIYAIVGTYHWATMGAEEMLAALAASPFPADLERGKELPYGLLRRPDDLAWCKASVPFWWDRIGDLYHHSEPNPDRELVLRLARGAEDAYQWCQERDFVNPFMVQQARLARLVRALLEEDEQALRAHLQLVAEKNDKRLRDDSAQWIGDAARSLDLDWYRQVIDIWREELDYKPKYYWIAWRAMLNHAPEHALIVAREAADRFADDPAFVEEMQFMKILADPEGRQQAEATAQAILEQAPSAE